MALELTEEAKRFREEKKKKAKKLSNQKYATAQRTKKLIKKYNHNEYLKRKAKKEALEEQQRLEELKQPKEGKKIIKKIKTKLLKSQDEVDKKNAESLKTKDKWNNIKKRPILSSTYHNIVSSMKKTETSVLENIQYIENVNIDQSIIQKLDQDILTIFKVGKVNFEGKICNVYHITNIELLDFSNITTNLVFKNLYRNLIIIPDLDFEIKKFENPQECYEFFNECPSIYPYKENMNLNEISFKIIQDEILTCELYSFGNLIYKFKVGSLKKLYNRSIEILEEMFTHEYNFFEIDLMNDYSVGILQKVRESWGGNLKAKISPQKDSIQNLFVVPDYINTVSKEKNLWWKCFEKNLFQNMAHLDDELVQKQKNQIIKFKKNNLINFGDILSDSVKYYISIWNLTEYRKMQIEFFKINNDLITILN